MRYDPVGMIGGLGEVVTCVYGPAVTYAFPESTRGGVSALGGAREPDQHSRWDGTQLVQTRRLESADE